MNQRRVGYVGGGGRAILEGIRNRNTAYSQEAPTQLDPQRADRESKGSSLTKTNSRNNTPQVIRKLNIINEK